jgi:hypothetical protein
MGMLRDTFITRPVRMEASSPALRRRSASLFCMGYMDMRKPISLPVKEHVHRLKGVGHTPGKKDLNVYIDELNQHEDFNRVHTVALQQLKMVDLWLQKNKQTIRWKYEYIGKRRPMTKS